MNIQNSKVAKHLDVSLYKFIWQVVVGIIGVISLWFVLVGRVDKNEINITNHGLYGQETRTIVNTHIVDTKGDPLSEIQLQNKVENMEDDVTDNSTKINKHEEVIHKLVISEAVQQVQNVSIIDKLEMIAKKLDE